MQSADLTPSYKGLLPPEVRLSIGALVTCNPTSQLLPGSLLPAPLPTSLHCVLSHLLGLTQPKVPYTSEQETEGEFPLLGPQGQGGAELTPGLFPAQNVPYPL